MRPDLSRDPDIRLWPTLSYHYGLSWLDLAEMPRWLVRVYADELRDLLASDQLRLLEASAYPHLKRAAQQRISGRWLSALRTADVQARPADRDEWEAQVAGAGIRVVREVRGA